MLQCHMPFAMAMVLCFDTASCAMLCYAVVPAGEMVCCMPVSAVLCCALVCCAAAAVAGYVRICTQCMVRASTLASGAVCCYGVSAAVRCVPEMLCCAVLCLQGVEEASHAAASGA
jgi:hypothetical protein